MATTAEPLKAPFPYPGGKSRVADLVWSRLGNVSNYVEPFMGSLAVLLRRPAEHFAGGYRVETCGDANHFLVNFWRAVKGDPEKVAEWADWPVTEADLHARHKWLIRSEHAADWRAKMAADPEHFDAKVAGWWAWGACAWIGGAWCNDIRTDYQQIPGGNQDGRGYGLHRGESPTDWVQTPDMDGGRGVPARPAHDSSRKVKMPNLGQECATGGIGVHGVGGRPQLTDVFDIGRGVNAGGALGTQRPFLGGTPDTSGAGMISFRGVTDDVQEGLCNARRAWLVAWMRRLSDRLRLVRTCYGHWSRICDSDSTLTRLGTTGVFLDPPYPSHSTNGKKSRDANLYATDKGADLNALRDEVLAWCRKWGQHPDIRVAVCGYEGDGYEPLVADGWEEYAWEASGGYGNQRKKGGGKADNAKRERIWFSPACLKPDAGASLFDCLPA